MGRCPGLPGDSPGRRRPRTRPRHVTALPPAVGARGTRRGSPGQGTGRVTARPLGTPGTAHCPTGGPDQPEDAAASGTRVRAAEAMEHVTAWDALRSETRAPHDRKRGLGRDVGGRHLCTGPHGGPGCGRQEEFIPSHSEQLPGDICQTWWIACVRVCMRACTRACMRVCVRVCGGGNCANSLGNKVFNLRDTSMQPDSQEIRPQIGNISSISRCILFLKICFFFLPRHKRTNTL